MNVSEDLEPWVTHCIYYMYTNALSVQGKELLEMFSTKNPIFFFSYMYTHTDFSKLPAPSKKRFFSTADSCYYVFHVISRICNTVTTEKSTIIYVTIFIPI